MRTHNHQLVTSRQLAQELPNDGVVERVGRAQLTVKDIISGGDPRLLVIVGPCSIHDPEAALDYAWKLSRCAERYGDDLVLVMRAYFEKPRTTSGWKGLIHDPGLDGSCDMERGLRLARRLLLDINGIGLPCATELLDGMVAEYIADLIAWGAIGARTSESQVHRQLASGLDFAIGFKNSTTGNVGIAIDAILAASQPQRFIGVGVDGGPCLVSTSGNTACHVVLRGANRSAHEDLTELADGRGVTTNYDQASLAAVGAALRAARLPDVVVVDCSHGNSGFDPVRQLAVAESVARQIASGARCIAGVMIESHLVAGRQEVRAGGPPAYGQSITDGCLGWEETEAVIATLARSVSSRTSSGRAQTPHAMRVS